MKFLGALIIFFSLFLTSYSQKYTNSLRFGKVNRLVEIGPGFKYIGNYGGYSLTYYFRGYHESYSSLFSQGSKIEALILPYNHNDNFIIGVKYDHQIYKLIKIDRKTDFFISLDIMIGLANNTKTNEQSFYSFPIANAGAEVEFLFINRFGLQIECGIGNVLSGHLPYIGFNGGLGVNYYFTLRRY